jgi:hypothetical protein
MTRSRALALVVIAGLALCGCSRATEAGDIGRYVLTPANVAATDPNHPGAAPVAAAWVLDSRSGEVRYCTVSANGTLGC